MLKDSMCYDITFSKFHILTPNFCEKTLILIIIALMKWKNAKKHLYLAFFSVQKLKG